MYAPLQLQALRNIRSLIKGEWVPDILVALRGESQHFSELRSRVNSLQVARRSTGSGVLHDGILSRTLQRMEHDGLVERRAQTGVFPPSVEYRLTPLGEDLIVVMQPLAAWIAHRTAANAAPTHSDQPCVLSPACHEQHGDRPCE
ncbi:winged helix-turn-helix transcriptional regulator [Actinoalloteichus fjordicus]|uniref:Transcriptional regulator, HxlR family n=1 Tax=Actinoalloteichus fjordicus TaxID=1612552 RepID=A0AAC9LE98_9PSEU|nr:helix-turn-helix domain-containing protein [Actinoalloteichus fjordicus]APU15264.1 transcriptional regulator, HxlR family [Actinoalloteichus fjordicus]